MRRNYFFIFLAVSLICLFLMIISVGEEDKPNLSATSLPLRPVSPFLSYMTGVGIVEASSDNIFIGTPLNRLIEEVFVSVGKEVKKTEPLIQLENRDLLSDLRIKEASLEIAQARLDKLRAFPRTEDLRNTEMSLKATETDYLKAKSQYERTLALKNPRAISEEERDRRLSSYKQAEAKWEESKIALEKIQSGSWGPDLRIAELEVLEALAQVERIKTEIQRTTIRSPINGKVLQVNIHAGEFPPLDTSKNPLMIVGDVEEKYLKVSINQFNAPDFNPSAAAVAFLQGDARLEFPLEFVRLEPYLVNKHNLTNELTEKVDTRVLHVIYRFIKNHSTIFVGQQMDVFIETNLVSGNEQ